MTLSKSVVTSSFYHFDEGDLFAVIEFLTETILWREKRF